MHLTELLAILKSVETLMRCGVEVRITMDIGIDTQGPPPWSIAVRRLQLVWYRGSGMGIHDD